MVSLFGVLNIGTRGLSAAQAGLNTTGNNISNVNTEGYSRQRVVQRSVNPIVFPNGSMGQGSEVVTVERIRDLLLEGQINGVTSDKNYNEELDQIITRIQSILSDPLSTISDTTEQSSTGGFNNLLSRFFEAFQELSNTPEAPEVRAAALESAQTLAQAFSVASENLQTLRQDLDEEVNYYVGEINRKTSEIALLNEKIATVEGADSKVSANDYHDRRDLLISELSEIIPVKATENPNGTVNLSLVGLSIVDNVSQTPIIVETTQDESDRDITSIRIGKTGLDIVDDQIRQGKLGAILDARDRMIPDLQNQVDTLARGVIFEANKIHSQASGVKGYSSVNSQFDFPGGIDEPDTNLTLDRIFNNPLSFSQLKESEQPFPIQDGSFSIRAADEENETREIFEVDIKTSDTLYDVVERIDRCDGVVNTARSSLRFDPVFVDKAQAKNGATQAELVLPVSALAAANGAPISETPGVFTLQIHLRNKAGGAVDSNTATTAVDPFTVNLDSGMTLQQVASAIQAAGGGKLRAQLVPSEDDPTLTVLSIEGIEDGSTISIQNDTSGLIKAFDFSITDPSTPLIGGTVTESTVKFTGLSTDSLLGAGNPMFNPVFTEDGPTVIGEGSFNLVVVNNMNQLASNTTITLSTAGINTLDELAAAIETADAHLSVEITADRKFKITSSNDYSYFFQGDTTGLIDAMGLSASSGYGSIGDQSFQDGSFEIVVANEQGKVTHIVEVPVKADPSFNGGLFSLNDIVDQINRSAGDFGAPLVASIVSDPTDPTVNQLQIKSETGYEFTFRSDDSLLLSSLGFLDGPVLQKTGESPLLGADETIAVGDSIGGLVRAKITDSGDIEISTAGSDQLTFVSDSSQFLAAAGINSLFTGTNAQSMQVNEDLINDVNLLAASKDGTEGNNEAALAMAELQDRAVLENMTLHEYYRSTIAGLGNEGSRTRQFLQTSEEILNQLESLREQNSGVSVDEESVELIRFQRAYQASARFISTVDGLLDVIINQIGG